MHQGINVVCTSILLSGALLGTPVVHAGNFELAQFSSDHAVQQQLTTLNRKFTELDSGLNGVSPIVLTVGADVACSYTSIQAAVNASTNDNEFEIRVANNKTYTENISIDRKSLQLIGGFDNCSDAQNNVSNNGYTHIEGDGSSSPVFILSNSNPAVQYENGLANFDISLGTGLEGSPSGGINVLGDRIDATLHYLLVHNNAGLEGGGLYVEGAATTVYAEDVLLVLNEAINGGGVYCDDASIIMYGDSGISLNTANGTFLQGSGGGLYATNGCAYDMFSGTSGGLFDFRGIAGNKANRRGGGIYVEQASVINLWGNLVIGDYGNPDEPVNINANESNLADGSGNGGGIYAAEAGTQINAYGVIINDNQVHASTSVSSPNGAGVHLSTGASFSMSRLNLPCWDDLKCNQISDNFIAGSSSQASGVFAIAADVTIKNTWISGHTATESAAFMFTQFSDVRLEGNIFVDNGGNSANGNQNLFYFYGGDNQLAFNTFAQNELSDSYIQVSQDQPLTVVASIFQDDFATPVLAYLEPDFTGAVFDCIMAHEVLSFGDFASRSVVDDPEFVDAANQDFHLSAISPAIDYCDNSVLTATTRDLDNESRNRDSVLVDNGYGFYDLGADEVYPDSSADISVEVELLETPPFYKNQTLHYTVTVGNEGPDVASQIQVSSEMQRLQLMDIQPACDSLDCEIVAMPVGDDQVYQVTARITQAGEFDLSVSVLSDNIDPVMSNNTDDSGNGGLAIEDIADLSVSMELLDEPPYHSGQVVTYFASVINLGPDTARNVILDEFFQQTTNVNLMSVQGLNCSALPCQRDFLPANTPDEFLIEVEIISGQSFNYVVAVSNDASDPDPSNNRGNSGSQVANPTADLMVVTSLRPAGSYVAGQTVTFDIVYTNLGPQQVGLISVDAVADKLQVTSISGGECAAFPCQPSAMEPGDSRSIEVTAVISAEGEFGLSSSITSGNYYDLDMENNQNAAVATTGASDGAIFADSFESE